MPVAFIHEVPGHVQMADHVQNKVQVKGGTNWDLSRSAVETPIAQLQDPEPVRVEEPAPSPYDVAAVQAPLGVVTFKQNSALVSAQGWKAVKPAVGKKSLLVTGHADAKEKKPETLALKRAEAVARHLRNKGSTVEVRSAGASEPGKPSNRRVTVHEVVMHAH